VRAVLEHLVRGVGVDGGHQRSGPALSG
jgi:hypothetical protein